MVVSDRYVNYFHPSWEHIAGHQACLSHLLRDYEDAAETYPGAIWPVQAQRALRGLIRAWHDAHDAGLAAIPADVADPLALEFRRAVRAGLAGVPRLPGPKYSTAQHPGRDLLEFCSQAGREDAVLRFTTDTAIGLAAHRDYPMVSLDNNNAAERMIRGPVVTRKNAGGSRNGDTARNAAVIWTVTGTAQMAGLNILTYLTAYLDECGRNRGKPLTGPELERLLPWNASPEDLRTWAQPPPAG